MQQFLLEREEFSIMSDSDDNKFDNIPIDYTKQEFSVQNHILLRHSWILTPSLRNLIDFEHCYITTVSSFLERIETDRIKPWQDCFVPTNHELGDIKRKIHKRMYHVNYFQCSYDYLEDLFEGIREEAPHIRLVFLIRVNFANNFFHCCVRPFNILTQDRDIQRYLEKCKPFPSILSETKTKPKTETKD